MRIYQFVFYTKLFEEIIQIVRIKAIETFININTRNIVLDVKIQVGNLPSIDFLITVIMAKNRSTLSCSFFFNLLRFVLPHNIQETVSQLKFGEMKVICRQKIWKI